MTEIVIPANADEITKFAGEELQLWVKEISGAQLPVSTQTDPAKKQIVLTTNSGDFPVPQDWQALEGSDGYAVRPKGNSLYITAWKSKGLLNGVFRLLMRNTDIVWARPAKAFSAFFTPNADLTFSDIDYIDRPTFEMRGWQVSFPIPELDLFWNARNCSNWTSNNPAAAFKPFFKKTGIQQEAFYAHNIIRRFMKRDLFWEKHPEYYSMQKGKRIDPALKGIACPAQLCFSNREMIADFLKRFDEEYAKTPNAQVYMVSLEDNFMYCDCPQCRKPIELPDGSFLPPDADNFNSTRFYLFLNEVARHLDKIAPGKEITTFSYVFAEIPPAIPVEKNIRILLCPAFRNYRFSMASDRNRTTRQLMQTWAATGNKVTIYDYYGLYGDYPRPIDRVAKEDLLFEEKLKFIGLHSELMQDNPEKPCYWHSHLSSDKYWDVNSIYIWVAAQLFWNPHQDVDQLRRRYLQSVFGAAAADIAEYLKLTEQVWQENYDVDDYHTNQHAPYYRLAEWGMVEKCRAAIARARSRNISQRSREMLERLVASFESRTQLFKDSDTAQEFRRNLADNPAGYTNLLDNVKWNFWKRTTGTGGTEALDGSAKKFRFIKDGGSTVCYFTDIPLQKDGLYWFTCRIRMENTDMNFTGFYPKLFRKKDSRIIWLDGYTTTFFPQENVENQWVTACGFIRVPAPAESVRLQMVANQFKGKVWFDAPQMYLIK